MCLLFGGTSQHKKYPSMRKFPTLNVLFPLGIFMNGDVIMINDHLRFFLLPIESDYLSLARTGTQRVDNVSFLSALSALVLLCDLSVVCAPSAPALLHNLSSLWDPSALALLYDLSNLCAPSVL